MPSATHVGHSLLVIMPTIMVIVTVVMVRTVEVIESIMPTITPVIIVAATPLRLSPMERKVLLLVLPSFSRTVCPKEEGLV
jgi:hypothetical protein